MAILDLDRKDFNGQDLFDVYERNWYIILRDVTLPNSRWLAFGIFVAKFMKKQAAAAAAVMPAAQDTRRLNLLIIYHLACLCYALYLMLRLLATDVLG
eukprot:scaffold8910_cov77-Skeletonema_dohrnii-CCMP3373.AAC.2